MTERHSGYLVTLEKDRRRDDAEALINAIKQLEDVIEVEPVKSDINSQLAKTQAKQEIRKKIWEAINNY